MRICQHLKKYILKIEVALKALNEIIEVDRAFSNKQNVHYLGSLSTVE